MKKVLGGPVFGMQGWQASRKLNTRPESTLRSKWVQLIIRSVAACFKLYHHDMYWLGWKEPIQISNLWFVNSLACKGSGRSGIKKCFWLEKSVIMSSIIKYVIRSIYRRLKKLFWCEAGTLITDMPHAPQSRLDSSKFMRWWDLIENGVTVLRTWKGICE